MTDKSRAGVVSVGRRDPGQLVASAVAVVFLLVGTFGIVPALTGGYERPAALAFGVFVHLAFGVVGSGLARSPHGARVYLVAGGVLYFLLQLFAAGGAAHWPHLLLAASMIGLALLVGSSPRPVDNRPRELRELPPVVEPVVPARRSARNRPPGRGSGPARVARGSATRLSRARRGGASSRSCAPGWPMTAELG